MLMFHAIGSNMMPKPVPRNLKCSAGWPLHGTAMGYRKAVSGDSPCHASSISVAARTLSLCAAFGTT